jgi:O6-methylguanine-DNA--protein-cysteine methyltransferase
MMQRRRVQRLLVSFGGRFAIAILLLGGMFLADGGISAAEPVKETVTLVIDYADGVEKHFRELPWKTGATVLDVMQAAQRHPRGSRFVYRGTGDIAFLTQIDDLKNEGNGRNWIFSINGDVAKRSFAVSEVKAGDRVLWKFTQYK